MVESNDVGGGLIEIHLGHLSIRVGRCVLRGRDGRVQ